MFAIIAGVRLVLVAVSIGMWPRAMLLSVLSVPVVHVAARLTLKVPSPISPSAMRMVVAGLLGMTGVAMAAVCGELSLTRAAAALR